LLVQAEEEFGYVHPMGGLTIDSLQRRHFPWRHFLLKSVVRKQTMAKINFNAVFFPLWEHIEEDIYQYHVQTIVDALFLPRWNEYRFTVLENCVIKVLSTFQFGNDKH
jgi:hypothetical protein